MLPGTGCHQGYDNGERERDEVFRPVGDTPNIYTGKNSFKNIGMNTDLGNGIIIHWAGSKVLKEGICRADEYDGVIKFTEKLICLSLLSFISLRVKSIGGGDLEQTVT